MGKNLVTKPFLFTVFKRANTSLGCALNLASSLQYVYIARGGTQLFFR